MSGTSVATIIRNLSRQLAEGLRDGRTLISDARETAHLIREAEGWLMSARRFLDADDPLSAGQVDQERTDDQ